MSAERGCAGARLTQTRVPASPHPRVPTATLRLWPVWMTPRAYGGPRLARAFMGLISQETALANAAGASAKLRQRRHEREEVDAYLVALHAPTAADIR